MSSSSATTNIRTNTNLLVMHHQQSASMASTTDHHHHHRQKRKSPPAPTSTPLHHHHSTSASIDNEDGCCLARVLLQNLVSFATSRRKNVGDNKENAPTPATTTITVDDRIGGCASKSSTTAHSVSHAPDASGRSGTNANKLTSANGNESSVCDSMDESMLQRFCTLPAGVDLNEWLATHTMALFHHVNALYGADILCTKDSCPVMCCPGSPQLLWIDDKNKKTKYSAADYINHVLSFCQDATVNEEYFPTKYGNQFSPTFESHMKRVCRLLWHCIGHLCSTHWNQLNVLALRPQACTVLAHLYHFCSTFDVLDSKELTIMRQTLAEIRPLQYSTNTNTDVTLCKYNE